MNAKVMAVFGTRPEVIKLSPVLRALRRRQGPQCVTVATSQQADLLPAFLRAFDVRVDHDLGVMVPGQSLNMLLSRTMAALDPVLQSERPGLVVVQGDTTTALAGAMASYMCGVPVAHVEAGLRTHDSKNPYPEELNRTLITRLASLHLAPTQHNVDTLLDEGIAEEDIVLTGNPVVDALDAYLASPAAQRLSVPLLDELSGKKIVLLTYHRRESFGPAMRENLRIIRRFIERHDDTVLVFPVHPNPAVKSAAKAELADSPRIRLVEPLDYEDFLTVFRHAWLVLSDSGGIQEEAPTLGKPLLVLRRVTERPEAIDCGIARMAGVSPAQLAEELERAVARPSWLDAVKPVSNPFGDGNSGPRIADAIVDYLRRTPVPDFKVME